jgi:glutamine synthetase
MEDHYFASIKERILNFMADVDEALWRLGIPAKTRHNEVAPAQFEIAPIFEGLNLAVDHNMQLMDVLRKTAIKHGFACLLHEKPFDGINGSGKHNNWSLGAPGYGSLLNPGKSPHENAIFLTILGAVIEAVDTHADLLRASIAKAGNDHRLGANEAPPAIISVYLGDQLDEVIRQLESGESGSSHAGGTMKIGVDSLPEFPLDTSDRNRTSPFAFTGNKFEFRAVGSSQTCAWPMTVLNTIVAEALDRIATELEPSVGKPEFRDNLQAILRDIIAKHKKVIFNGNGYSEDWVKEAERRGLPHLRTTPEALQVLEKDSTIKLFNDYNVMSPSELHARYETQMEIYDKEIDIETKTAIEMVETQYIPAIAQNLRQLHGTISAIRGNHGTHGLECLTRRADEIGTLCDQLPAELDRLKASESSEDRKAAMEALRVTIDSLEKITDHDLWPVPTYAQLLYIR